MRQDRGLNGDAQRIEQLAWMLFLKIMDDQDKQISLMQKSYKPPLEEKFHWRNWAGNPEGITGDELLSFVNVELFPALKSLSLGDGNSARSRIIRNVFEDALNYMKSGQLLRQVINKINEIDFNSLSNRQHFGDIYEQILQDLQSAGNAGEYYTPRALTEFMVEMIDPKLGEIVLDPACGTGGFLTCAIRHIRDNYVKKIEDEKLMQSSLRAVEKMQLPHILATTNMLLHEIEEPAFIQHGNTLARPYVSYTQSDRVDVILTNPPFGGTEELGIESNFPAHLQTRETADLFLALIVRLLKDGGRAAVVLPDGSLFGDGVKMRVKEQLLKECNLHTVIRLPNSVFKPYAGIGTNLLFFEKGSSTKDVWYYQHVVPPTQKAYSKTKPIKREYLNDIAEWWGGSGRLDRIENQFAWKVDIQTIIDRGFNLDINNPNVIEKELDSPEVIFSEIEKLTEEKSTLIDDLNSILGNLLK